MKNKRFIILSLIILILATMVISCMACSDNESSTKIMVKQFLTADSFTVENNNVEVIRYSGNTLYYKELYENKYDEYYFMPDNDGKYWAYERRYSEATWTKKAFVADEYLEYVYGLKVTLGSGLGESIPQLIEIIFMDFDSLMLSSGTTYSLKSQFMDVEKLELAKVDKKLSINISVKGWYGNSIKSANLLISNINNTKVILSQSASLAKVGEISLS